MGERDGNDVSIPLGTINTIMKKWTDFSYIVSIPLGTINTSSLIYLSLH